MSLSSMDLVVVQAPLKGKKATFKSKVKELPWHMTL
jgi:hypothetical protein